MKRRTPKSQPAMQNRSQLVQDLLHQALRCHRAGQLVDAERIYRRILAIKANHADCLHLLGLIVDRKGDRAASIELIRRAIAINPQEAAYHSNLGAILRAQGNLDEAAECFRRALAVNPDFAAALTNLGNILEAQARLDEAVACHRRSLALNPESAEAYSNLGNALHAQGDLDGAVAVYERALALKPDYVDGHNNLGVALLARGRAAEAIIHYKRALELNPKHSGACSNLGVALAGQGRITEAIACYRRAIEQTPEHIDAHNNLGAALGDQGMLDDAIAHYEQVLAINPRHPETLSNLGNILKELGRFDEAVANYEEAIAAKPDLAEAHWNRAEIKSFKAGDADLAALEALAATNGLSAKQASKIHFALAKALEDIGDYVRAFEHLRKGNSLIRDQLHYDEAVVLSFFKRISHVFDSALLDRFRGEGDPSSVPVFVLGMPRSGSTLVEQILASHPHILAAGELTALATVADRILNTDGQPADYPEFVLSIDPVTLRRLGQAYLAKLPSVGNGVVRIVDKSPGNFFKIGLIRLILPNARIIHTLRDPVDTCLSCYSKPFPASIDFSYDLAELGRYYRSYEELMIHWRSILPSGAMLDVCYEDVVDDLEGQARRLIDYCGLPWDDRCLSFHEGSRRVKTASAVQVRKPLFRSSLQRWRKYEAFLSPLLIELGKPASNRCDTRQDC